MPNFSRVLIKYINFYAQRELFSFAILFTINFMLKLELRKMQNFLVNKTAEICFDIKFRKSCIIDEV